MASRGLLAALSLVTVAVGLDRASTPISPWGRGPGITNHPVHVIPSGAVNIPADWPLDARGAITCLTCHTRIPDSADGSVSWLRDVDAYKERSTEFCSRCHRQGDRHEAKSVHWLALGEAHPRTDRADRTARLASNRVLDAQTRRCLSCHDGASATESGNITPWTRSRGYQGDQRRNHPVGVRYPAAPRPKDLSPLRPASLLPEAVALPDGKVGCVSCHDLYAQTRHLLTVPIQGSQLCLTCHDLG